MSDIDFGNAEEINKVIKKKVERQSNYWKVNYHLHEDDTFDIVFEKLGDMVIPKVSKYIFAEEYGKSGITRHIEGYFITPGKTRRSTLLKIFPWSDCQASCPRNCEAGIFYCTKERNKIISNIPLPDPVICLDKSELWDYQRELLNLMEGPKDDRTIFWVIGEKNVGKTKFLKYLCMRNKATILPTSKRHALSQVHSTHNAVGIYVFNLTADESRYQKHETFSVMESIKDELFASSFGTETNGMCIMSCKHLLIMGNECPDLTKTEIDIDRFKVFRIDTETKKLEKRRLVCDVGEAGTMEPDKWLDLPNPV